MKNDLVKYTIQFTFLLALITVTICLLHFLVLHFIAAPLFDNNIIGAYVANYALAIVIFGSLVLLKKKFSDSLGFIFMGGSILKFACFFIFFYPSYKLDGKISPLEFSAFFIPYTICLITEVIFLIKLLKD
ncbi:MAG: hypothetical protein J5I47_10370 [Vicingus serpentipes]|nr:hypothetical protein [Vicingus serpentipes]